MGEKEVYQDTAKQTLKKLVDEKLEAVNKQKELEKALSNIEDEYASLKELHDKDVAQNRELAVQVSRLTTDLEEEVSKQQKNVSGDDSLLVNSSVEVGRLELLEQPQSVNGGGFGVKHAGLSLLNNATVTVSVDNEAATTTSLIPTANTVLHASASQGDHSDPPPLTLSSGDKRVMPE